MKLTTRCGSAAVDGLNEALLAKAAEAKLLRTNRVRVDTTVVPANVAYPTDSGLLAKAIGRIAATGRRIQAAGGATRTKVRDRSRAAGQAGARDRARSCGPRSAAGGTRRWPWCGGSPASWPTWPRPPPRDAERLLANAKRRCAGPAPRPPSSQADGEQRRGRGAAAGPAGPRGQRPDRPAGRDPADRRPDPAAAGRARPRTARPGGSACTTRTPGRSPRAGSASRSSSATRPRSSTTTTAIVLDHDRRARQPRRRAPARARRRTGHQPHRPARPAPSPPTAATARAASTTPCTTSASATS